MKRRLYLLLALLCCSAGGVLNAQDFREDPRYGADPESREQNVRILNAFNDAYREKDYNAAATYLPTLIQNAPKASENMYIRGLDIYRQKALAAQSRADRNTYVDSIMWVYDKRIEAFGDHPERGEAVLRVQKAKDFINLMPGDKDRVFQYSREALATGLLDPALVVQYFQSMTESFKLDDVTADELMDTYNQLTGLLAGSSDGTIQEAANAVEQLFVTSGAASCENIERIFRPQYEADPDNVELIEKILALFQRGSCSTDFQLAVLEKYYDVNPKPELALQLSSIFRERGDNTRAMEYMRTAANSIDDPELKVAYLIQMAGISLNQNSYREAANYAQQIISANPNSAHGYFFLANAYAGGSGSACSDFDRQTVYWLVVDNLQKARSLAGDDATLAGQINGQIGSYVANFPKTEETFMRNLSPGQSYTVNCGWISGRTTVRER